MTITSPWIAPKPTKLMMILGEHGAIDIDLKNLTFFLKVSEFSPKEGQAAAVWASGAWHAATYNGDYWQDENEHDIFDVEIYVPLPVEVPKEFVMTGKVVWAGDIREE